MAKKLSRKEKEARYDRMVEAGLCIPIDFCISDKSDTGTSESTFDPSDYDPKNGYIVRGIGPVYRNDLNPECDAY